MFFRLCGGTGWPRLVRRGRVGVSQPLGHVVGWVTRWVKHGGSEVVPVHELASRVGGAPADVGCGVHPPLFPSCRLTPIPRELRVFEHPSRWCPMGVAHRH